MASVLRRVSRFFPGSRLLNLVIDQISRRGFGLEIIADTITTYIQPVILQLKVKLVMRTLVQHVNYDRQWDLMLERAMEESQIQWERFNNGMVPADESSLKNMIKKMTEVEGGDCMVCLEELDDASDASQMPCSHAFHSSCIQTWLKQSHYCPVCRFEMPTKKRI